MDWAQKQALVFDDLDTLGREEAVKAGHSIITLDGGVNNPAWKPVLETATNNYLGALEDKGMPARKVYDRAMELSKTCL